MGSGDIALGEESGVYNEFLPEKQAAKQKSANGFG